jgi:cobalt-zinc-cadmium efflux system membrane fusion protein
MMRWFKSRPDSRPVKYGLWIAAGGLLAAGLLGLWALERGGAPGGPPGKQARAQRATPPAARIEVELTESQVDAVKLAPVGRSRFDLLRPAVGSIDFNQNMLVQVFTPNQGRIIASYANVGDRVEKGQMLFTVDSPDLLQASSNLISAAGVLVLQTRNLKRLTETLRGGGGAQKDVDQATSDQQAAEGALRAARDAMRIFGKTDEEVEKIIADRKADSTLIVRNSISGVVTARTAAPGLFVQPGNAPAPFSVADTSTMWMIANVVESDSALLRVGQEVRVRVAAYPDREFDGSIVVVGASVDPQTRRIMVRSEIKDPDRLLRAGMFANFTIRVGDPIEATSVADSAIVREGDGTMTVWVTTDRRHFEKRTVKTGLRQRGVTQIFEGVQPGDLVVTDGALFLSNKLLAGAAD